MRARIALAVFVALAALQTWPLSAAPWRQSLNYNADAEQCAWTLCWVAHTLPADPARLVHGNIFAPEPATLTYSEPMVVPGLVGAPVRWLGGSAVLTFNIVLLAGLVLTAWATWFVAWRWTGAPDAALVAGALAAFNPHLLTRLPHVMAAHAWGMPLTWYFADRLARSPRRRDALWLALIVAATAATSIYWLALCGVIVAVVMALALAQRQWRGAVAAGAAAASGLIIAAPILLPYVRFAAAGARRPIEMVADFSASPAGYLTSMSRLHAGWSSMFFRDDVNVFFAGVAALGLAAIGLAAARRSRAVTIVAVAAVGVLLSLGPATAIYRWLYEWVAPLQGLRAVARFGYLYLLAVAMAASVGTAWLAERGRRRVVVAAALAVVSLEATMAPIRTEPFHGVPAVYDVVAGLPDPVLLVEVPFFPAEAVFENGEYVLNATRHWRPVMNGTSGFTPVSYRRRAATFWFFPAEGTVDAMRQEGATHLMVHLERFTPLEAAEIRTALLTRRDVWLIAADREGHQLYEIR